MIICQKRFCRHEVLYHDCAATILKALNLWDGNSALHFPIWVWCCSKCNLEKGWHRNIIWHFSQHFSICTDRNQRNVLMLEPWLPWFKPSSSTTWITVTILWSSGNLNKFINAKLRRCVLKAGDWSSGWNYSFATGRFNQLVLMWSNQSICNSSPITYLPQKKLNWQQDL